MSLISEGLKKAQLDAMRQDHQQRRVYLDSARPGVAAPRSIVPQMLAIGLGSAVITGGALLWLRNSSAAPAPGPAKAVRAPITPSAPAHVEVPETKPVVIEKRAEHDKPVAPSGGSASARSAAKEERAPSQPERPKETARVQGRDGFIDGQTYASPINGVGGTEVSLSGIAGAGDQVLAIINGRTVRPGAMIGPFVVESIERRRVQLRYIDVRFYLTP